MTTSSLRMTAALAAEHRARLLEIAEDVKFPEGYHVFEEGRLADRFWIIKSGTISLHMAVPGRRPAVIENLGFGELVGWSWLFPPFVWQLGAETMTPVRAQQFDARTVRMLMDADPALGSAVGQWVGRVLAHRLHAARVRLLDLYAPYGSGITD
ncbi:cyclic nucleotide-binding domain-containing protein [Streptomyces sp. SCSIO 30461]|uniref:Crp/Fnr family transcriptional regulator n=1 Tax=Streptomyces sp. SCSIO 30461 TaxID=3118085 RepID=UPI0030CAD132